ncbi:MAG: hypothetical protein EBX44_12045, partial [Betaproteobacteria bacterium]|nr:hypothetical protein [Betaproteobacteria bacterium]
GLETVQAPDIRERSDSRERLDAKERYLLAGVGRSQYAIPLSLIDRVVRDPVIHDWDGQGVVHGFVLVEGWLVWLVDASQVFTEMPRMQAQGDWLLILKEEQGLSRIGLLAEDVKGPVAFARIEHARIVQRRRGEELDDFR